MGYKTFALTAEINESDARFIYERYHAAYPGVAQFHRRIEEQLRKDRTLTNLYGRRYLFLGRWGHELFKDAYAFIPQSTIADKINRDGLLYIWNNPSLFPGMQLLNQVHDSIVLQLPRDLAIEEHMHQLQLLVDSLELPLKYAGREFVIPAEVKVHTQNLAKGTVVSDLSSLDRLYAEAK